MTSITTGRYLALTIILTTLLGVGSVFAAPKIPTVKVSGSFDIPKKEYKVGETVRGKFIFVNKERPMTITVKRWDRNRFILVKKNVKLKRGERSSFPVEWKVEKPGKQVIQYQVDGSWHVGKKASGFTRTFDHVINDTAEKQPAVRKPSKVGPPPASGTVCRQNDYDCFIAAAQACISSKMIQKQTVDLFGVKQTTTSHLEFKGLTVGKCTFYIKNLKNEFVFPPGTPQATVQANAEAYKKIEGRDGTCKASTAFFVNLLTNWKEGNASTEDWEGADCSGKYFETSL